MQGNKPNSGTIVREPSGKGRKQRSIMEATIRKVLDEPEGRRTQREKEESFHSRERNGEI